MPHTPGSNTKHNATDKQRTTPANEFATLGEAATGKAWDGGNAPLGPGASISSGFGGLGLDGIIGSMDASGAAASLPGDGSSGVMSGDSAGEGERGEDGRSDGAAEMVVEGED